MYNGDMYSGSDINENNKNKKIIYIFIIIFVCILLMLIFIGFLFFKVKTNNINGEEAQQAKLNNIISRELDIIESAAKNISNENVGNLEAYLSSVANSDDRISIAYYVYEDNTFIESDGWKIDNIDWTERSWYKNAINNLNETYISDIYYNEDIEKTMVSLSRAVVIDEKINGVLGMDIIINDNLQVEESNVYCQ